MYFSMEGKKMIITRATIPGWLKSPDAAQYLGLTESQFRKVHPKIKSIQLHKNGPRFFRQVDVDAFLLSGEGPLKLI